MLKLHGSSRSRSARCLWALEELGVKYEHVPVSVSQTRSPEHLKLNPNGHIPVLEDDGLVIWESMAINLYLAEKYGKNSLWPASIEDHGRAYQWSFWGMTEVEPHLITVFLNRIVFPPDRRDEGALQRALEALKPPFKVLNDHLAARDYLLGNSFTVADLNVAAVLRHAFEMKLDFSATPKVRDWLGKCLEREANKRVQSMK